MANITVEILPDEDIRYVPGPQVKHGDTVTFQLVGIAGEVDITFDAGHSCLSPPGPYHLNGSTLATSASQEVVSTAAAPGPYPFTVHIHGPEARTMGGEAETKKGGIDVTVDPTEESTRAK